MAREILESFDFIFRHKMQSVSALVICFMSNKFLVKCTETMKQPHELCYLNVCSVCRVCTGNEHVITQMVLTHCFNVIQQFFQVIVFGNNAVEGTTQDDEKREKKEKRNPFTMKYAPMPKVHLQARTTDTAICKSYFYLTPYTTEFFLLPRFKFSNERERTKKNT